MSIWSWLNSPSVKAFAADFILTLAATLAVLNVAPQSFRELVDMAGVIGFAAFKSAVQAVAKAILTWAQS